MGNFADRKFKVNAVIYSCLFEKMYFISYTIPMIGEIENSQVDLSVIIISKHSQEKLLQEKLKIIKLTFPY